MQSTASRLCATGLLAALVTVGAQAQPMASGTASQGASTMNAKSMKEANRALKKQVVKALSRTKGLQSTAITVRANDGTIVLQGTVPEQSQIDLATRAAQSVQGVTSVNNALTLSTF